MADPSEGQETTPHAAPDAAQRVRNMLHQAQRLHRLDARELHTMHDRITVFRVLDPASADSMLHAIALYGEHGGVALVVLSALHWLNQHRAETRAHTAAGDPFARHRVRTAEQLSVMARESMKSLMLPTEFGPRLVELRLRSSQTQAELAHRLGVSAQTVGNWESGRSTPHPTRLATLSKVLGVSRRELLGE